MGKTAIKTAKTKKIRPAALVFPSRIINNWAFVSVQVVEQVQLFRMRARSYHFSVWVRNRERGGGHFNEANNFDLARKFANSRNSRLETMEASTASCVSMWRHFWPSISVCSLLCSGDAHAKSWVGLHQEHASEDEGRGPRCRFPRFLCLLSGRRWRGDLGAGQGSWRWGFAAKAGWKGQLVKETGFAEVQKQKEYQRKTLETRREDWLPRAGKQFIQGPKGKKYQQTKKKAGCKQIHKK